MPLSKTTEELAAKIRQPALSALRELRKIAEEMGALSAEGVYEFVGRNDITIVASAIFAPDGDEVTASVNISQTRLGTVLRVDVCIW